MSELSKKNNYMYLNEFMKTKYRNTNKVNILPIANVKNKRGSFDKYVILLINSNGVVTDFGNGMSQKQSVGMYVSESIRINSLGVIDFAVEDVIDGSKISFVTHQDINTGRDVIDDNILPTVTFNIDYDNIDELNYLIERFRKEFNIAVSKGDVIPSVSYNMVYMSIYDFFCLCRGDTINIPNIGRISVKETGVPALRDITNIYKIKFHKGEIPFTNEVDKFANNCPEVNFYTNVSISLANSFIHFCNDNKNNMY